MARQPEVAPEIAVHLPVLDALCLAFDIALMMLFGSRAMGYARPDSDYDIGVLFFRHPPSTAFILSLHDDLQRVLATDRIDLAV